MNGMPMTLSIDALAEEIANDWRARRKAGAIVETICLEILPPLAGDDPALFHYVGLSLLPTLQEARLAADGDHGAATSHRARIKALEDDGGGTPYFVKRFAEAAEAVANREQNTKAYALTKLEFL
jgi:hypothetical protein